LIWENLKVSLQSDLRTLLAHDSAWRVAQLVKPDVF